MDIWELLRGVIPNAVWDLVKRLPELVGKAGMLTSLSGFVQRIRSGALDWWLLGSIFAFSLVCFYLSSGPVGVFPPSAYSVPEEQTQQPEPKDPGQRERQEFGQTLEIHERLTLRWYPRPGGFTKDEYSILRQEFLKIPRPCVFKITVPPENLDVFDDLRNLATTSFVRRLNTNQFLIEPCTVLSDPKDENPRLYADQLDHKPEGIIVVNSTPSNSEKAEFVANALRKGTGLQVRPESSLPPDSPENLIHIRVGKGAMRGFETTE